MTRAHPPSPRPPVVLFTGFEPFGGEAANPSALAAQALDGQLIAGHRVVAAVLPTVFGASLARLDDLIRLHQPALVLCCGQAGGRAAISLERVAINVDDARIPDNAGAQPVDRPVVAGAPAAYFSSLPIKAMLQALQRAGLPAEVSQTAGTFVCNHVFYGLMHRLAEPGFAGVRGGLVHIPWLPAQGSPCLPLEATIEGLRIAIACALATEADIRLAAGALD
ncbi:pyroglutamyl-peptidase I [Ramlibacter rhizophilus]|uniref:Pyrrolidone-carboxylate peptidase n=1 Tax=Ramlibacter rhizophilus TaxID=1781167 RepID=A0A4Z0BPW9_9BURK|nr:pyroglutamyl-peptidase I [Ramlibacter rhizophilus]TFZ01347.1 pyroglutamyl-peptidase I [Ramlibacter rhizophilus]